MHDVDRNLRDHLLAALTSLPARREFHLHVLVTAPYKHTSLFPYASPRPRIYGQDVLVLLSEQPTLDGPRVLVSAIEAALYHIPATSNAIFYVSKVDSTGQGIAPPPTATLVTSLIHWYADPATRPIAAQHLWVHLFARAQNQYLFPNSSDHSSKKPLSDVRLCAWWRRILGKIGADVHRSMHKDGKIKMFYVLPGYNELEATQALSLPASSSDTEPAWMYGHPYSQTDIPLPCPPSPGVPNIGHIIPSFEDDPKNRFMDEIAFTDNAVASPVRKRPRTGDKDRDTEKTQEKEKEEVLCAHGEGDGKNQEAKDPRPKGELGKLGPGEFWERMSFRQECIAGAVTGFFVVGFSAPPPPTSAGVASSKPVSKASSTPSPLAPQPGQVPRAMNKRVLKSLLTGVEFSTHERAVKATEIIEGSIRGLCEGLSATAPSSSRPPNSSVQDASGNLLPITLPRTPPRISARLPNVDDVSPNPFDEPEATLETYYAHIYGTVMVKNAPLPERTVSTGVAEEPKVNVLAVRKKKKRDA
ncbi:histone acetylation protein-domain-containing protein [Amylostereum chailletii]|nr:histone acetylation protein-domain-containing protein [Amylostereum chailletii]